VRTGLASRDVELGTGKTPDEIAAVRINVSALAGALDHASSMRSAATAETAARTLILSMSFSL